MIYSSRFLSNFPCLVPLVLTRAPRSCLWFNEECFEYRNNCTFPWDGDYDAPPDLPLNKDATIVKECFDRIMQEADLTYMDDTYSRGLWIRRLARFARDGFRDCGEFERCDKFIEGWNIITLMIQVRFMWSLFIIHCLKMVCIFRWSVSICIFFSQMKI